MSNTLKIVATCALLLFCWPSTVPAQTPADQVMLTQEIVSLRVAIRELSTLMESMLEQQQAALDQQAVELGLRRLDMAREELEPIRKELRAAREQRRTALEDQEMLGAELDRVNEELSAAVSAGNETRVQQLRGVPDQISIPLQRAGDKIWRLDQRIIELENELAAKEEALAELSQAIDQWLGLE